MTVSDGCLDTCACTWKAEAYSVASTLLLNIIFSKLKILLCHSMCYQNTFEKFIIAKFLLSNSFQKLTYVPICTVLWVKK